MQEKYNELNDEQLAALLQTGDGEALSGLMERYQEKLIRYGRRFIASDDRIEDAVQEVFLSVYQNIRSYNPKQKFSPWIYRIAHNAFVDVLRKKGKEPLYYFDFDQILPHPVYDDPAAKEKEKEEIRVIMSKGLETIAPAYREIIDLYYFENFSYKEIADILHVPIGTVGIRLSRARAALKKLMVQEMNK